MNQDRRTSILFLSHRDQNKHDLWLPLWSEVSAARGLEFYEGPPFLKLSFLAYKSQIYKLWGLRRKIKRHIYFFLNWCRFPDGIRSYYWLRRNTCLCPSLVLGTANLANASLWISKQINKAFSVFADTHYPFLLKLCQMQTQKASFSSLRFAQNLLGKYIGEISISDSLYECVCGHVIPWLFTDELSCVCQQGRGLLIWPSRCHASGALSCHCHIM